MGEGNGTPLQYSCLENLMDGRAYQAPPSMGFSKQELGGMPLEGLIPLKDLTVQRRKQNQKPAAPIQGEKLK